MGSVQCSRMMSRCILRFLTPPPPYPWSSFIAKWRGAQLKYYDTFFRPPSIFSTFSIVIKAFSELAYKVWNSIKYRNQTLYEHVTFSRDTFSLKKMLWYKNHSRFEIREKCKYCYFTDSLFGKWLINGMDIISQCYR